MLRPLILQFYDSDLYKQFFKQPPPPYNNPAQPASITELHSSRSTKLHLFLFVLLLHPVYKTAVLLSVEELENPATEATEVVYHLQQFSGKTGWRVNGTRRFWSSQRKISGSNGTSEKMVQKEIFVFHFFKAIFDTSFRPSRPFSGKCDWRVQMLNAISGTKFTCPELCEPFTHTMNQPVCPCEW